MKIKDKRVNSLVAKMVESCVSLDGTILEKRAIDFVSELAKLPKYSSIPAIQLFQKLLKMKIDEHTLLIETDYDLTSTQIKTIEKSLNLSKITQVKVIRNKDILGGLRVRVGDKVFDDTINIKIEQLGVAIRS